MNTILVVDDDPHIRELLQFYLQRESYRVLSAADGKDALDVLEKEDVHLSIVDIMMPNMDGYQLCEEIRSTYDIPVLMLTAKGEIADKEKAYQSGTDDYLVKPFEPKEVLFRIQALLRRFHLINTERIHVGNTLVNRKSYEVECKGKTVILPLKEFELLAQLASYPDRIFSREQLIAFVWGDGFSGKKRTVDVHIKRLRERFSDEQYGFLIQTVRGMGYKLVVRKA